MPDAQDFPKPASVKWDVDGFAAYRRGRLQYLLEKAAMGQMMAHQLRVQSKILKAMSKRQLRRIISLAHKELAERERP